MLHALDLIRYLVGRLGGLAGERLDLLGHHREATTILVHTKCATTIVSFRDDLSLSDHCLHAAANTGAPVVCLYVLDDSVARPSGAATRRGLAQSLRAFGAAIAARGGSLVVHRGAVPELKHLPAKLLHRPRQPTPIEPASAGTTLGKTYPRPIVFMPPEANVRSPSTRRSAEVERCFDTI